ncbi:MAG TPA: DUF2897 domain-containing protein [Pseudomonas sp.]|jgi:hypothetical protein|uniref:DUF2897 domain-containing protein n=1 Tax=Halopseudomonas pachastrellae TaxID=254161 RepID=A0A1S8DJB2_9GAMM|nr:DUF2897 family protein [Halopseudomonas pachastrellae]MAB40868.1 DUF2897 domain-containing protein [Pseudomonadales bacterium]MAQ51944.1 DUF2897 domain-containing protein [Pseudomonas sp.]MED5490877.1 DUF2897 family protein [Pseudomonadota bacterium]MBB49136.1 DUF2897 domain-containing protein [Pseudomonadales bacterium]MBF77438.1 DUF2897 domain-containing protein [Pseudomonadales bacterium]|tara:strand:+ start:5106 stop:5279 length:174 start_codon:yes stop_codon:yes gene_type:complete
MPWYGWLFMALALGSIVGSLLLLRDNAGSNRVSPETIAKVKAREAQLKREDAENDAR